MNSTLKRVISLLFILILVASLAAPAFAAGTIYPRTGTAILYRPNTGDAYGNVWVSIAYGNTGFGIRRSDIQVLPGTSGAQFVGLRRETSSRQFEDDWSMTGNWKIVEDTADCRYSVNLKVNSTGTAFILYKINGTTYILSLNIKEYKNPIKSITLTGVNKGKNFASLTKKQVNPTKAFKLNKTVKSAKLKVTAADGWRIRSIELVNTDTGDYKVAGNMMKGSKSASINWGTLKAGQHYEIHVSVFNDKEFSSTRTYIINPR